MFLAFIRSARGKREQDIDKAAQVLAEMVRREAEKFIPEPLRSVWRRNALIKVSR